MAEVIIESSKPLALLGAQLFYIAEPFLGRSDGLRDAARALEDPQRMESLKALFNQDECEP